MRFRPLVALALLVVLCGAGRAAPPAPVVLISLDGFRWDYCALHPDETPNLRRLAREGVAARGLIPAFPSNTFPNHYSIATGLYPSHHGIVNNDMFDAQLGEFFHYKSAASNHDPRWWGGEPIWITAVKQQRASGCFFWIGSEAEIKGGRPTFWRPYDYANFPFEKRLDEISRWLHLPAEKRPAVIALYFEEVNGVGHRSGPDSPELAAAVKLLDSQVGALVTRLAQEDIAANYVIVSDHGMTPCDADRTVMVDDFIDLHTVQVDFEQTTMGLRPAAGNTVEKLMTALARLPPQAKAYRAEELPARFHIDPRNPRVPPVWIVPAEGWQVFRRSLFNFLLAKFDRGQHGYDPALPSMRGIFIAQGPAFKSGIELEPVENVHVYNLLCAAAGLTPAPNDGDDRLVKAVLR
jgi:predicted AlkP superfamily pyrophosphatase or phosphodiesterase